MTSLRRRPGRLAVLLGAWLLTAPHALGGEKLLPPDPSAPPVHVLLTLPAESGNLARHVARLDRALAASRGFLLRAHSLEEADAVVEFTRYRRTVNDKGVTEDWWYGQFRLLTPPARGARLSQEVASRFALLIIDREPWEIEPVVDLLARTMARALGRESRPRRRDSI